MKNDNETYEFDQGYAAGYNAGLEQGTEDGYALALAEIDQAARAYDISKPYSTADLEAFWYDK